MLGSILGDKKYFLRFDTFDDFPAVGDEEIIYYDDSVNTFYVWSDDLMAYEEAGQYPQVDTFAELPPAADNAGKIYFVKTSTGIWPFNKPAGFYYSNGTTWTQAPMTAGALTASDVIDNLTSTITNKPLSANQGRVLNEKIVFAEYTDEDAQDAIGSMLDSSLVYNDATPLLSRAAIVGAITAPEGSNVASLGSFTTAQLDTALSDNNIATENDLLGKVDTNISIIGATKTKITYDAKGLVTSGQNATTTDIADSVDARYVTDNDLTTLSNTSGINTGDETAENITGTTLNPTVVNSSLENLGILTELEVSGLVRIGEEYRYNTTFVSNDSQRIRFNITKPSNSLNLAIKVVTTTHSGTTITKTHNVWEGSLQAATSSANATVNRYVKQSGTAGFSSGDVSVAWNGVSSTSGSLDVYFDPIDASFPAENSCVVSISFISNRAITVDSVAISAASLAANALSTTTETDIGGTLNLIDLSVTNAIDGDIAGSAPAGTLTGATLNSSVVNSSLTNFGSVPTLNINNAGGESTINMSGVSSNTIGTKIIMNRPALNYGAGLFIRETGAAIRWFIGSPYRGGSSEERLVISYGTSSERIDGDFASNAKMIFDPNGTIGIGTTFPDSGYKLDVNGAVKVNSLTLNNDEISGTKPFVATGSGGSIINSTFITSVVNISTVVLSNANYTLAANSVEIITAGVYKIEYTIRTNSTAGGGDTRGTAQAGIRVNLFVNTQGKTNIYLRDTTKSGGSSSAELTLAANDEIKIVCNQTGAVATTLEGSQISIIKL